MIRALVIIVLAAFVLAAAIDQPVAPTPIIRTVTPSPAKAGDHVVAAGDNLGQQAVASLYLTKGEDTFEVVVQKQTDRTIEFTVPASQKAGRFGLMVLTRGEVPRYIDEPVYVTIE
jgi:hypothetical protein